MRLLFSLADDISFLLRMREVRNAMADPFVKVETVIYEKLETGALALKESLSGLCLVSAGGKARKVEGPGFESTNLIGPGERTDAKLNDEKAGSTVGDL